MDQHPFSIRQVSEKTGVNSKTLRYWEMLKLLPKPRRTHTNYRLYSASDLDRIIFVRKAKSLGFTLSEIRKIFALCGRRQPPCGEVVDWAGQKIQALEQQIDTLTQLRARLIGYHRKWKGKGACPPVTPTEICCFIEEIPLSETSHTPQRR